MLGNIRVAQLISILFLITGIVLLIISIKKFDYYNKEEIKENKEVKTTKKVQKKNSKKKVK